MFKKSLNYSLSLLKRDSLTCSKNDVDRSLIAAAQNQQTPIIYLIYFLIALGQSIGLSLPVDIFKQIIAENNENEVLSPNIFGFYPTIARFCASIVFGFVSDRFGRKIVLNICLLGSVLPMILYGFTKSYFPLAFLTVILSIFRGGSIIIIVLLIESNSISSRSVVFSCFHAIYLAAANIVNYIRATFSFATFIYSPFYGKGYEIYIPFVVSGLIAGFIYTAAFILSYYYLNETLADKRSKLYACNNEILNIQENTVSKPSQVGIFGFNLSKHSILLLISASIFNFISKKYITIYQDWSSVIVTVGELNLRAAYTLIVIPLLPVIFAAFLLKYDYVYSKISALKLFKASFPVYCALFPLSLIVDFIAKTENAVIVISPFAILCIIECGFYTLCKVSFELLITESGEIFGNLGALFCICNGLFNVISKVLDLISRKLPNLSIDNSILFPMNCNLTYFLVVLSLIGYWLSSKIKIATQKDQEIIRGHEC